MGQLSVITGLIERHVPKKKYTSSKNPPWYGREIEILSKDKKRAWKAYKRNPTSENWNVYAKLRNKLSHKIEHLKSEYENKIASEVKSNSKKFWKYVSNKTKSKGKITILNDNDGNEVTDDQQKAELLNNYLASVFTKENVTKKPDFVLDTQTVTIMNNIAITEDRIAKHLNKLNTSKASGPDGINARVLKN